jgi:sulfatase maturation enzyme AslB (radical SAM superfamily)
MKKISDFNKLIHEKDGNEWLAVNWCLTNVCNYRCTYCDPSLHDGSVPLHKLEVLKTFVDRIFGHAEKLDKRVLFEFAGGEVTYLKYFGEFLEYIGVRKGLAAIVSNGSSPLAWWEKNIQYLYSVSLSLHIAQLKDFEHFKKVAKLVAQSSTTYLHLNIMMDPKHFDRAVSYARELKETMDCSLALQPLFEGFGSGTSLVEYQYTPEQKQIMETLRGEWVPKNIPTIRGAVFMENNGVKEFASSYDVIIKNWNDFSGWYCNAGVENIVVDLKGDIYRGWCFQDGKIGNLLDEANPFQEKPVLCGSTLCHCGFDICSTKSRELDALRN